MTYLMHKKGFFNLDFYFFTQNEDLPPRTEPTPVIHNQQQPQNQQAQPQHQQQQQQHHQQQQQPPAQHHV
jgi:hypothetical protein